jgi:hypothetical protein
MHIVTGQPVQIALEQLGDPDRQETIVNNQIYHWDEDQPAGSTCTFSVVTQDGLIRTAGGTAISNDCGTYVRRLSKRLDAAPLPVFVE